MGSNNWPWRDSKSVLFCWFWADFSVLISSSFSFISSLWLLKLSHLSVKLELVSFIRLMLLSDSISWELRLSIVDANWDTWFWLNSNCWTASHCWDFIDSMSSLSFCIDCDFDSISAYMWELLLLDKNNKIKIKLFKMDKIENKIFFKY